MGRRGKAWADLVRTHFGYLSESGFEIASIDDSSFWEDRVTYRTDVSALAVIRSNEFTRVEVQLMRLVNGELPDYPIFVVDSVPVNTFYLDDLLATRMPDADAMIRAQHGLGKNEVAAQLQFWSDALRQYGGDFLDGDIAVLDELEAVVRARAAQSPSEVSVWLPDGTSPDEVESQTAQTRATVPPGVEVVTRWYRPGRKRRGNGPGAT